MKHNYRDLIARYDEGLATRGETVLRLIPALAESGVELTELSDQWAQHVLDDLNRAPDSDAQWATMRVFRTGAWTSQEGYEESQRRNRELLLQYRRGVEMLRKRIATSHTDSHLGDENRG